MKKKFNTTGPCFPERHYMVDPLKHLKGVEALISAIQPAAQDGKAITLVGM